MSNFCFKPRQHLGYGEDWIDKHANDTRARCLKYCEAKKIVVADCDGILTDGKSSYTSSGKTSKVYGAYDKEAIDLLSKLGWDFLFVTSDKAGACITESRLKHLEKHNGSIKHDVADPSERFKIVETLIDDGYKVLFIGDSLSDIRTLNIATWAATTANAPDTVKAFCEYVSALSGGDGGFADILLAFDYKLRYEEW